jgi:hypothetical protein
VTEVVVAFSLTEDEKRKLLARAQASGTDLPTYVRTLIEEDLKRTPTLSEILAPIHEDFRRSGMTEEELEVFLEGELSAARNERRAKDHVGERQRSEEPGRERGREI